MDTHNFKDQRVTLQCYACDSFLNWVLIPSKLEIINTFPRVFIYNFSLINLTLKLGLDFSLALLEIFWRFWSLASLIAVCLRMLCWPYTAYSQFSSVMPSLNIADFSFSK